MSEVQENIESATKQLSSLAQTKLDDAGTNTGVVVNGSVSNGKDSIMAGSFGKIIDSVAANYGLSDIMVKSYFNGRYASFLSDQLDFRAVGDFMSKFHRNDIFYVGQGSRYFWDTDFRTIRREGQSLEARMVPIGRGRMERFPVSWYRSLDKNTMPGFNRTKLDEAYTAELTSFDSGYDKARKRDNDRIRTWLSGETRGGDQPYLSFIREGLCGSLVSRSLWKNYLNNTTCAGFKVRNKEKRGFCTYGPGHSPGTGERLFRIVTNDHVMDLTCRGKLDVCDDKVFVSRAKTADELAFDIFALWAGMIPEHSIYEGGDMTLLLAHIDSPFLVRIAQSWGTTWCNGYEQIGAVVAHLYNRDIISTIRSSIIVSSSDNVRILDYKTYRRFRFSRAGHFVSLLEMEGKGNNVLNMPEASWTMRLSSCYSIVELAEDSWVGFRKWHSMEQAAFNRGVLLGQAVDMVMQSICGHWRNLLSLPNGDELYDLLTIWSNVISGMAQSINGSYLWTGIRFGIPGRAVQHSTGAFNVFPDNRWHSFAEKSVVWDSAEAVGHPTIVGVTMADLQPGEGEYANDDHVFSTGPVQNTTLNLESTLTAREGKKVWLVMTRQDWYGMYPHGLTPWWKIDLDLVSPKKSYRIGTYSADQLGDFGMSGILTRALCSNSSARPVIRLDIEGIDESIPIRKSYGYGCNDHFVFWPHCLFGNLGLEFRLGVSESKLESEPLKFSVYGDSVVAAHKGSLLQGF
uniref:Coat protein n=1 Tax=Conidiobolus chlamydosporus totivirus 2 TaxID=2980976 RepID=A0A977R5K2_9VIRU|nr:coat protein [Conidiobolus chlamydosporus totivirus 2]